MAWASTAERPGVGETVDRGAVTHALCCLHTNYYRQAPAGRRCPHGPHRLYRKLLTNPGNNTPRHAGVTSPVTEAGEEKWLSLAGGQNNCQQPREGTAGGKGCIIPASKWERKPSTSWINHKHRATSISLSSVIPVGCIDCSRRLPDKETDPRENN